MITQQPPISTLVPSATPCPRYVKASPPMLHTSHSLCNRFPHAFPLIELTYYRCIRMSTCVTYRFLYQDRLRGKRKHYKISIKTFMTSVTDRQNVLPCKVTETSEVATMTTPSSSLTPFCASQVYSPMSASLMMLMSRMLSPGRFCKETACCSRTALSG